jgi:hypothetical protein
VSRGHIVVRKGSVEDFSLQNLKLRTLSEHRSLTKGNLQSLKEDYLRGEPTQADLQNEQWRTCKPDPVHFPHIPEDFKVEVSTYSRIKINGMVRKSSVVQYDDAY